MKNLKYQKIRLTSEDLKAYDTTIGCESLPPKFILDRKGRLFQKNRTVFNSRQSRLIYSEVLVAALSNVEVTTLSEVVDVESLS